MIENEKSEETLIPAEDEKLMQEVIDNDHELHYLDCYLSEIFQ